MLRDIAQLSLMSSSSTGFAFRMFCRRFAKELYPKWTRLPEGDNLREVTRHSGRLNFTGGMGSIDDIYVAWARALFNHALSYTGKERGTKPLRTR